MATDPARTYPSELPLLALRQTVVFPLTLQPLAINRPTSIDSVNRALNGARPPFLTLQKSETDAAEPPALHTIGTIGAIRQMAKMPTGGVHVIVEGLQRAKADVMTKSQRVLNARVAPLAEASERSLEIDAYV